jgi:hypothetical protein
MESAQKISLNKSDCIGEKGKLLNYSQFKKLKPSKKTILLSLIENQRMILYLKV